MSQHLYTFSSMRGSSPFFACKFCLLPRFLFQQISNHINRIARTHHVPSKAKHSPPIKYCYIVFITVLLESLFPSVSSACPCPPFTLDCDLKCGEGEVEPPLPRTKFILTLRDRESHSPYVQSKSLLYSRQSWDHTRHANGLFLGRHRNHHQAHHGYPRIGQTSFEFLGHAFDNRSPFPDNALSPVYGVRH